MNNKVFLLYFITGCISLMFSGTYVILEECYQDEDFNMRTYIDKTLYVKYCADDWSINPFDSYYSKLEMYLIYLGWMVGVWNLTDAFIMLGVFDIEKNESCKGFVTKRKKEI